MSGEVLRAMMVRVASRVSVVRSGGSSSSSVGSTEASVSQPSVVRMRRSLSKRLNSFDSAPRPRCTGSAIGSSG